MRQRVRLARRGMIAAMMAGVLLTTVAVPAHAYHRDRQRELDRLIQEKRDALRRAESQERDLLAEIRASDERRAVLERQLAAIEDELAIALARLHLIEIRLDRVAADLRLKTRQLEATLAELEVQTALLQARVQYLYMDSAATLAATLRAADDFNDFVAASEYQASIVKSNMEVVEQIENAKLLIESQRADVQAKQVALEADRREADAEANRIGAIRSRQASATADVQRELNYRMHLLSEVRDRKAAYKRALDSYLEESQSIAAFLRGAQGGQQVIQGRGGYLKWPLSGRITSPYGWRTHPVYGYRSFHTGIDIGGNPSGTSVRAARSGSVLYTGYKGAYGLIVIVDHGNALATLYAHLSRTYVRAGEHVNTLENVGAVGSTGWSTGPHLHFEVRVNGEHQNPMNWL